MYDNIIIIAASGPRAQARLAAVVDRDADETRAYITFYNTINWPARTKRGIIMIRSFLHVHTTYYIIIFIHLYTLDDARQVRIYHNQTFAETSCPYNYIHVVRRVSSKYKQ